MPYDNKLKEINKPDTDGVKSIYSDEDISHSPENLPCTEVHHQAENVASGYEYTADIFVDTDDVSTDIFSDEMNNSATSDETISPLKAFITAEFTKKRPQFTEYKTRGYNAPLMDLDVISALKAQLQKERTLESDSVRSRLIEQAEIFANAVQRSMPRDAMKEKGHYHAGRLVEATMRALEALETVDTVNPCDWKTRTEEVIGRQLDTLTGDAVTRITQAGTVPASNNHASALQQQLRGLLFSPSQMLAAENIKFAKLRNSWLAEDRGVRNKLTSSLNTAVEQILSEAREAKKYALQHLSAGGKPAESNFLRVLPPLADALEEVMMTLRAQATLIAPSEGDSGEADEEPKVDWVLRPVAAAQDMVTNVAKSAVKQGRTAAENLTFMTSQWLNSIKELAARSCRALKLPSPGCSDSERRAVRDTGLLLLDELHQVKRRIMLLPSYARSVQEAVEQHQQMAKPVVALFSHNNILDELLDEQLKNEGVRWSKMIQRSQEALAALTAPVARLAVKEHEDSFKSGLKATLFGFAQIGEPEPGQKATELFWEMTKTIVHSMAQIAREVDGSTERLAGRGHAGGIELKTKVARWLQQLEAIDGEVRATIAAATGAPLDYFSRGGMLARGVAEWAEGLKQAYLETVTAEHRDAQAALFTQTLTEVIRENRDDFSKKSDPDADQFLQRLALELGHAAQNTTVWPPSPEEVLAGVRTLPDDIRHWAEKKVVSGALSTLVWQGVKLVSSPVSIPTRLAIWGARMGWSVNRNARAIKKGVRMGQGAPNTAIKQLTKRELSRAAFRVTVSLSPVGGWALAALITAERLYGEKGSDGMLASTLTTLPEDVLWQGGSAGLSQVLHTHIARTVEQAVEREEMQEWEKTPAWEADVARLSLAPELQTETESLSENSEQNGEQRSGRNKRSLGAQEPPSGHVDEAERQKHQETLDKIKQSGSLDLEHDLNYGDLSHSQKVNTYKYAVNYVLHEIEHDKTLPKSIRNDAYLARHGAKLLVPVDVSGDKITNTLLLPNQPGSKTGVLLCLDDKKPYTLVRNGSDLPDYFKWDMRREIKLYIKQFRGRPKSVTGTGVDMLRGIKNGDLSFNDFVNHNNPEGIDIADLALKLVDTMKHNYSYQHGYRKNKTLIHRGLLGAYIPDDGVSVEPVTHKLETSWDNLTPEEYLRSVAQPFATLSGQMQLIVSSSNEDSIQTTERKVEQAQYIGAWIDVTASAVTSFSGAGIAIGMLQSVASITADAIKGKAPEPLDVAGLVLGCIPVGRAGAYIGKFSHIAGEAVKYGLMIENKVIDLTFLGKSIQTAINTGDPLAIYEALFSCGLSLNDSYQIARHMSTTLKIPVDLGECATPEQLKDYQENLAKYAIGGEMKERKFLLGKKTLLGRIHEGEIDISDNDGVSWQRGSKIHLLAYRLQNAGGKYSGFFESMKKTFVSGENMHNQHIFTIGINSQSFKEINRPIRKVISMLHLGAQNISEKNVQAIIDTAQKNPDYKIGIVYDSSIPSFESAKYFMVEKFAAMDNIHVIDVRDAPYFYVIQEESLFAHYEQAIQEKNYGKASDIMKLLILKYEGGVYKNIDDTPISPLGSLSLPLGIGLVEREVHEAGTNKDSTFSDEMIAVTDNNPVIDKVLALTLDSYIHGEENGPKRSGPDILTEAVYGEIPELRRQGLSELLDKLELAKRESQGQPLVGPDALEGRLLTMEETATITQHLNTIRGLAKHITNDKTIMLDTPEHTGNIQSTSYIASSTANKDLNQQNKEYSLNGSDVEMEETAKKTKLDINKIQDGFNQEAQNAKSTYNEIKLKNELESMLFNKSKERAKIHEYFNEPSYKCYDSAVDVFNILKSGGYNPRAVGVLFLNTSDNASIGNHYVISVQRYGVEMIADVTIRQFDPSLSQSDTIQSRDCWEQMIVSLPENKNKTILNKEYENLKFARDQMDGVALHTRYYELSFLKGDDYNIMQVTDGFRKKIAVGLQNNIDKLNDLKKITKKYDFVKVKQKHTEGALELEKITAKLESSELTDGIKKKIKKANDKMVAFNMVLECQRVESNILNLEKLKGKAKIRSVTDVDTITPLADNLKKSLSDVSHESISGALKKLPDEQGIYELIYGNQYIRVGKSQWQRFYPGSDKNVGKIGSINIIFDGRMWNEIKNKEAENIYQIRGDVSDHDRRVVNPKNSNPQMYATPINGLNGEGLIRIKGKKIYNLNNVSSAQARPIRSLIRESKGKAVETLKSVSKRVRSKNKEDIRNVDKAFEIFIGKKLDVNELTRLKEKYISVIKEQKRFLNSLKSSKQISYHGGYDMKVPSTIFQTTDSVAKMPHSDNEPLIKVYVDSIADTNKRLGYSKERFENFISTALIHESYHAVNVRTPDLSYPKVHENSLDISGIVSLSEPLLRDNPINDIIKNRELLEDAFADSADMSKIISLSGDGIKNNKELSRFIKDRLDISDKRVWQNPDNVSYMTTLISYIGKDKSRYDDFVDKFNIWKKNTKTPLLWDFEGSHSGNIMTFSNTDIGKLRHGNISPLMDRGLAAGSKTENIDLNFEYIRNDKNIQMQTCEHFTIDAITEENGKIHGAMNTWKGGAVTSQDLDGTAPGLWGNKFTLNDNVNFIEVVNGQSGTVAIKIPLNEIQEGKPVIISAGSLSGCSMIYAVDDGYFYVYHVGQQVGDTGWLTSRDGVSNLYDTHQKLTNKALDRFETGHIMSNNDLVDIFSKYEKSVITYYGKDLSAYINTKITKEGINVDTFDYNQMKVETRSPRLGLSYALLAKSNGNVKVKVYSEDLLFELSDVAKFSKLSGKEFSLKE